MATGTATQLHGHIHPLFVAKRMRLSPDATADLAAGKSYRDAFKGAELFYEGKSYGAFNVIHSTFRLYSAGVPEVTDFAAYRGGFDSRVITAASEALRVM